MIEALSSNGDFAPLESSTWRWRRSPAGADLFINMSGSTLLTDGSRAWTAEAAISKLQEIAAQLGADLIGEEGEILTDVPAPAEGGGLSAAAAGALIAILALPFILLLALVRLPWLLWKIWRPK